ncbi:glycosyltransferase [Streptomyces sp. NPDC059786]|uniref:glycosyltransferase n=1 Tax=Streptomyces sp. NPDC059786 TaxID=3346946 RepID=UPI003653B5C1
MDEPTVSIFIRNRDEAVALQHAIASLRKQKIDGTMEIVVLDNESTDDSPQIAAEGSARVFTLPRELFGYGRALNLGVELCRGEIVVLLSSHSIPQNEHWLAELIRPIQENDSVGAAFCHQIPPTRVSTLEKQRFACFPGQSQILDRDRFLALCEEGADPYEVAVFSNSACAVRRKDALAQPFRDLLYAEDRAFAVDLVMTGRSVAFVRQAVVSYERSMTWKSAYAVGYRAQVSKCLIRELAATYSGIRYGMGRERISRLLRAGGVILTLLLRLALSLGEPRGLKRRSALYAYRATGATLGLAKGVLYWRRHVETLSCDGLQLQEARRRCTPYVPRTHEAVDRSGIAGRTDG